MAARLALLGYGRIGALHARTIREHVPSLMITGVADPHPDSRERAAAAGYEVYSEWRELVEHPDIVAVLIASATFMHPEQVIAAAALGKAIFCEKPLAAGLDETDAVLDAVRAASVPLQVGLQRRFDPPLVALRSALLDGDVGRPLLLRISARDPEPPPPWYDRFPGGLYIDSAIHDFDTARFLLGDISEITSFGAVLFDDLARTAEDVDTAGTLLRFASGALGVLDNCRISAAGFDQRVEVHGTTGTAATENMQELGATVLTANGMLRPSNVGFFTQRYAEAYVGEFSGFADVLGGAAPVVSGDDARAAFLLALAAEESRRMKCPIDVAQFDAQSRRGIPL